MPMLTMIFTIIEVKFMSQTLLHILGMISGYNRKVRVEKKTLKTVTKANDGTSLFHNILNVFQDEIWTQEQLNEVPEIEEAPVVPDWDPRTI